MPWFGEPGERIAYTLYPGPEGAPPLVLMHGFTASSAQFAANVPGLATRYTVVLVDLLGHGESDAPADSRPYGPGPAVTRIRGLLDELGYEKVLICGHSLGGALALRFALDAPERVAGLVVMNSNSAAATPAWRDTARASMSEMAAAVREHGVAFMKQTRLYPGHSKRLPPEAREALVRDFDRARPEGFAGTAEALVVDVNAWERLGELSVPTLVIIGDRDAEFVKNAPAFIERLPDGLAQTFTIEGAGHAANIERPALFDNALIGFGESIAYLPARTYTAPPAAEHARLGSMALSAVGAAMVVGGVGLLVAAVLVGRSGTGTNAANSAAAQAPVGVATFTRQSAVDTAAGAKTAGASSPASQTAQAPVATATATMAAPTTTPAAAADTNVPAATPTNRAAAPTATPTLSPTTTPAPTSTPAGPHVAIAGPATADVGQHVRFADDSRPEPITTEWSVLGRQERHTASISVTFAAPGCYPVTLTAYFPSPTGSLTTTLMVAVGGATCP